MNIIKPFFLAFVILYLSPFPQMVSACSVCGCGDPLQPAGTVHNMAGAIHLSFEAVYLTASAQSDDNPAQAESLTQKTLNSILSYTPINDLTIVAVAPYTQKDWTLSEATDSSEEGATATPIGLGDLNVGLRYFLLIDMDFKNKGSHNIAISAGSFVPTGNEDALDSNGDRLDQHAQLGTGEWGPYAGLLYTWINNGFTLSVNFNTLFHTVNAYQYHFGSALTWGANTQLHLDDSFAVSLGIEGRYADSDTSDGGIQTNTGGTVIDLTPGLWWNPTDKWGLYGKVQVPVITDLFGTQTVGATALLGTQLFLE